MIRTSSLSLTNVRLESRDGGCTREIDNSYHLAMASQTASQVTPLLLATAHVQAEQAAITLRTLLEQEKGGNRRDGISRELGLDIHAMLYGMDRLRNPNKLRYLGATSAPSDNQATFMFQRPATDVETCERWARQIIKQQRVLQETAEALRKSYDAHYMEIRSEADRWFLSGLNRSGRDRDEDWTDALRLLQATVDSTVGMQDYAAWFQIGWILWKHHNNLPQAEEAFYRAQRLSASAGGLYHILSLRHFAHMQYLQGRHEGAYQTIQKALRQSSDHDTRFEAARYAASTSRRPEAVTLLEQCIRERPTTALTMFAELDFQCRGGFPAMITEMAQLVSTLMHEVRGRLEQSVKQWRNSIHVVTVAQQQAECNLALPPVLMAGMAEVSAQIRNADYLALLDYDKNTLSYADHTMRLAQEELKKECAKRQAVIDEHRREIDEVQHKYERERRGVSKSKDYREILSHQNRQRRQENNTPLGILCLVAGIGIEVWGIPVVKDYLNLRTGVFSNSLPSADLFLAYLALGWFIFSLALFLSIIGIKRLIAPPPPPPEGFTAVSVLTPQQVQRRMLSAKEKIAEAEAYFKKSEAALAFVNQH